MWDRRGATGEVKVSYGHLLFRTKAFRDDEKVSYYVYKTGCYHR